MMKLFRLDVWKISGTARKDFTTHLAPSAVMGLDRIDGVTHVHTLQGTYFSTTLPDIILQGIEDVTRLNNRISMLN